VRRYASPVFEYAFSPRYLEVDQQGVVFNMWYLGYFDDAMAAFLAHLGHPYPQLLAAGDDVMLVRSELDWSSGVSFGDAVAVGVSVEAIGTTSFTLGFVVRRGEATTCRGRTVYVMIGTDGSGKRPIPATLRSALSGQLPA
jgi:acyl-CoA thioester hydrolase